MSKCPHNNAFSHFCIKKGCHYPTIAGCQNCFIQDHPHTGPTELINVEELKKLLKKYQFHKKIKPHCNLIQQAFFGYFRCLKSTLTEILQKTEQLCKDVVNNIGFPYLSRQGYFKVYKRIKNNDFTKISSQQLYQFVTGMKNISNEELERQQEKQYLKYIQKFNQMSRQIDSSISLLTYTINKNGGYQSLTHNSDNFNKIKDIITKIQADKGTILSIGSQHSTTSPQDSLENSNVKKIKAQWEVKYQLDKNNRIQSKQSNKGQNQLLKTKNQQKKRKISTNQQKLFTLFKVQQNYSINHNNKTYNDHNNNNNQHHQIKKQQSQQLQKPMRRVRRSSIDNHIITKNSNLERKMTELKNQHNNKHNYTAPKQKDWNQDDIVSQKQIRNYDLPHAESIKAIDMPPQIQIVPITRKLQENTVSMNDQVEQCHSPLVKRRRKKLEETKNMRESSLSSDNSSPFLINKSDKNHHGINKKNKANYPILQHMSKKQSNKIQELSEQQQLSYTYLVKSLHLKAEQAIILLQKSLYESQNNLSAAQYLSFLYLETNRSKKCLDLCNKYLLKIQNRPDVLQQSILLLVCNKSGALNLLGRYSETIALLNDYEGGNQIALKNLANAYLSVGKYQQAIPLYKKAIIDCNDDQVYYNLSVCWYMKEDYTASKFTLQSALIMQPKKQQYLELQKHINIKTAQKNKMNQIQQKQTFLRKY